MRSTRSHRPYRLIVVAILAVGAVTLAACSSGSSGSGATSATCPSASSLSAAAGATYTGFAITPGTPAVCDYDAGDNLALVVSLYPAGTSLKILTANVSNSTAPASGLGGSAAIATSPPAAVFVARTSAPSFTVTDETFQFTADQMIALAKAVIAW
ncbi:MAG: hypothetical protein ACYDGN_11230 [Acidimicrobiales bacterium]